MLHADDRGGVSPIERRGGDGTCCGGVVNPGGEGLGISLTGEIFDMPGLLGVSCFREEVGNGAGLLAAAQEVPGTVLELLGLELLGSGGTAYTVCFDT